MKLSMPFAVTFEVSPEFPDDLWKHIPDGHKDSQNLKWKAICKYLRENKVTVKINKTVRITEDMFCWD